MCTRMKVWILRKGTLKGVISVQKQSCVKIGKCMSLKKHTYPRKLEEENCGYEGFTVCFDGFEGLTSSDMTDICIWSENRMYGRILFFMLDCDMFRSMIHCSKDKEMEITHQRDYLSHIWKHWDNWIVPVGTKQAKMMRELFWSI